MFISLCTFPYVKEAISQLFKEHWMVKFSAFLGQDEEKFCGVDQKLNFFWWNLHGTDGSDFFELCLIKPINQTYLPSSVKQAVFSNNSKVPLSSIRRRGPSKSARLGSWNRAPADQRTWTRAPLDRPTDPWCSQDPEVRTYPQNILTFINRLQKKYLLCQK